MYIRAEFASCVFAATSSQISTSPTGSFHFGLTNFVFITDTHLSSRGKATRNGKEQHQIFRKLYPHKFLWLILKVGFSYFYLLSPEKHEYFLAFTSRLSVPYTNVVSGSHLSLPDVSFTIGSTHPMLYNLIWSADKITSAWSCHPVLYFSHTGSVRCILLAIKMNMLQATEPCAT